VRILYTNKVSPLLGGGAEARILNVGRRLVSRGHHVVVVCGKTEPGMPDELRADGIRICCVPTVPERLLERMDSRRRFFLTRYLYYLAALPTLGRLLAAESFDVWRDDIAPFPLVGASRLARRHRIPLVGTVHNLAGTWRGWRALYGPGAGTAGFVGERWLRAVRPHALVISDSKWMRDALVGDFGDGRVTWIPNGVDADEFRPGSDEPRGEVRFCYAGRFIPLKGHRTLLEAFATIVQSGASASLHLVGDGPGLEACTQLAGDLHLHDRVVFRGRLPYEEMPQFYRQMDVYVSPSRFEGMPMTFLEAMACGLPVVSTRLRAVEGILDETNSTVVEVDSAPALATAMRALIDDPAARRAMGRSGRRRVEARFTWDRVVDAELAAYGRIVSAAGVPSPPH
jgi:glycosyltransferase involved in cell wall biosynthesis